jgi:hypothetical protein
MVSGNTHVLGRDQLLKSFFKKIFYKIKNRIHMNFLIWEQQQQHARILAGTPEPDPQTVSKM